MFYEIEAKAHTRVPPSMFNDDVKEAIYKKVKEKYEGYISIEAGVIIAVTEIVNIGEGIIVSGDGAAYYDTIFKLITFKPEMQEVVPGKITDITDFGAFIEIGPIDGMIHISQTMDDFVSFSKSNVLTGKETKKTLKVNDKCIARIIALSYKEITNPKIGLTMRQPGLGKLEWLQEEIKKVEKTVKKK